MRESETFAVADLGCLLADGGEAENPFAVLFCTPLPLILDPSDVLGLEAEAEL